MMEVTKPTFLFKHLLVLENRKGHGDKKAGPCLEKLTVHFNSGAGTESSGKEKDR